MGFFCSQEFFDKIMKTTKWATWSVVLNRYLSLSMGFFFIFWHFHFINCHFNWRECTQRYSFSYSHCLVEIDNIWSWNFLFHFLKRNRKLSKLSIKRRYNKHLNVQLWTLMNYSNFKLAKKKKLVNNGTKIMLEEPQTGWPFEKKCRKLRSKIFHSN